MTTKLSGSLRLLTGIGILAAVGYAGFAYRSPAIILPFAIVFTVLYAQGKRAAWSALWQQRGIAGWAQAIVVTLAVQSIVVGVFYVLGSGLGGLFGSEQEKAAVGILDAALPLAVLVGAFGFGVAIHRIERSSPLGSPGSILDSIAQDLEPQLRTSIPTSDPPSEDEAELCLDPTTVDECSFFVARHFSQSNSTRTALHDVVDHQGNRPKRRPRAASPRMIEAAEQRLGFRLPSQLSRLYRRQDGGCVDSFWVPRVPDPEPVYDDWADAFAHDYDELKPLEQLRTLHDAYMEDFDPEYDEDQREHWLPGNEALVVLAIRTGHGTALDYSRGQEPGVVLFDLERAKGEQIVARFESFDAFFSALRREVPDRHGSDQVLGGPPDSENPDQFWAIGGSTASSGTDAESWRAAGDRLGVDLPIELEPFFRAANGGKTRFANDPELPPGRRGSIGTPFPEDVYANRGELLSIERWIHLRTLSDRLDFIDSRVPWAEVWTDPERLIVIAAAFDSALLLDYRDGRSQPAVVAVPDLDDPANATRYDTVPAFLSRLRVAGDPNYPPKDMVGDPRLSVRTASIATFWHPVEDPRPLAPAHLADFQTRFGRELPTTLTAFLDAQDGGLPRFRYLPPETKNLHGFPNQTPAAEEWIELFPGPILPMAEWRTLADWCNTAELPWAGDMSDVTPADGEGPDNEILVLVIGHGGSEAAPKLTLFDLSKSYFKQERSLLRADFDPSTGHFDVILTAKSMTNVFHGVFGQLRARRTELGIPPTS